MKGKIIASKKVNTIPDKAQWLGGTGVGSWFILEKEGKSYRIKRFSEEGNLECSGLFELQTQGFDILKHFQFTYLSHCQQCNILQNKTEYKFKLIENEH
jgi:hypothetical protein